MPKATQRSQSPRNTAQSGRKSKRLDGGDYICPDCNKSVRKRGRGSHDRHCKPRLERIEREQHSDAQQQASHDATSSSVQLSNAEAADHELQELREDILDGTQGQSSEQGDVVEVEDVNEAQSHYSNDSNSEMDIDDEIPSPRQRQEINLVDIAGSSAASDRELDLDDLDGVEVYQVELDEGWMPLSGASGAHNPVITSTYIRSEGAAPPEDNEIRVEYHPRSGLRPIHHGFYDYDPFGLGDDVLKELVSETTDKPNDSESSKPWRPFLSRLDFDIADFMLDASLNATQTNTLLDLFRRCISEPLDFSLRDSTHVRELWDSARIIHDTSKFSKHTVEIPYPKANSDTFVKFDTWTTSLWDWCDQLLSDPQIVKEFRWDAERVFKFDAKMDTFERCISEPWTADGFWDAQSKIPEGGHPLCLILYADKTQLSSFGTAKAYPVMARCANLPVELRNGKGVAGGRLVGWLPVVKEDAGETGKKGFIDLKRIVWHESFKIILSTILEYAKTGITKECGDGKTRTLYPIVLILSADYEEQCYMAGIRGINSAHPCPVCLIGNNDLSDLSATPILRTSDAMQAVYTSAQNLQPTENANRAKSKDKFLQQYGLRDVENAFWSLRYTDVYSALSWDRLHAYHGGLFSRHLWDLFKTFVDGLGKEAGRMIDSQIDSVPRWSGLTHFSSIIKTGEYTDSKKYEHMSKIIIYASHNVLSRGASKCGYILLQLIRSYLELDMFSSLLIQTDTTMQFGRAEMEKFNEILIAFKDAYPDKNWNFPKMHSQTHMFDDILRKGATRNYNTKPNEGAHRPLKSYYFGTNFKEIEKQILRIHVDHLTSLLIHMKIASMEEKNLSELDVPSTNTNEGDTNSAPGDLDLLVDSQIELGSPLPEISLRQLDIDMSLPPQPQSPSSRVEHRLTAPNASEAPLDISPAFKNIRTKINQGLTAIISAKLGAYKRVVIPQDNMIRPFRYLKVHYESQIDWDQKSDHLRCNPSFHQRDRHDFVLVQTHEDRFCFAQLLYMFQIGYEDTVYPLALVLPMDASVPPSHRARDRDLRFTRVTARSMANAAVIDLRSITRGALLVPDYASKDGRTFIVVDVVDADMWWRMKHISLAQDVKFGL